MRTLNKYSAHFWKNNFVRFYRLKGDARNTAPLRRAALATMDSSVEKKGRRQKRARATETDAPPHGERVAPLPSTHFSHTNKIIIKNWIEIKKQRSRTNGKERARGTRHSVLAQRENEKHEKIYIPQNIGGPLRSIRVGAIKNFFRIFFMYKFRHVTDDTCVRQQTPAQTGFGTVALPPPHSRGTITKLCLAAIGRSISHPASLESWTNGRARTSSSPHPRGRLRGVEKTIPADWRASLSRKATPLGAQIHFLRCAVHLLLSRYSASGR